MKKCFLFEVGGLLPTAGNSGDDIGNCFKNGRTARSPGGRMVSPAGLRSISDRSVSFAASSTPRRISWMSNDS